MEYITVVVGKEKNKLAAHKNIICRSSDFFHAALNGEWKEAQEMTVSLPETRPDVFAAYLSWLYTGQLDTNESSDVKYDKEISMSKLSEHHSLIDAYTLEEYVQDHLFRNAVVDETFRAITGTKLIIGKTNLPYLWEHVAHKSTLVKLLVDFYASDYNVDAFDKTVMHLPHEFLVEIARIGVRERGMTEGSRRPRNRPKCYYHEHKDGVEKCK